MRPASGFYPHRLKEKCSSHDQVSRHSHHDTMPRNTHQNAIFSKYCFFILTPVHSYFLSFYLIVPNDLACLPMHNFSYYSFFLNYNDPRVANQQNSFKQLWRSQWSHPYLINNGASNVNWYPFSKNKICIEEWIQEQA